jgi:hypothetical protein
MDYALVVSSGEVFHLNQPIVALSRLCAGYRSMHYSIHVFPGIRGPCITGPELILLNRLLVSVELLGALLVRTVSPSLWRTFCPLALVT